MRTILKTFLIITISLFLNFEYSIAQIIAPTGISSRATSQLIFYYDDNEMDPFFHVTNTNDTTGVWIHVQIFRNDDIDGDGAIDDDIFCDERDFVDFLTPNDTHKYDLGIANFAKNIGESGASEGELTSIDVTSTTGFIVVTPVVSEADFSAISFQHLIGVSTDDDGFIINALGRDAVDFTTGEIVPTGTPLDGVSNGFVVLQPEEIIFDHNWHDATYDVIDIVGITFADNYGPAGLLGYNVTPADATWTSFSFDFKEDPTSCGNRQVNCFLSLGLNDTITQNNADVTDGLLCEGTETPDHPDLGDPVGWVRIFVSGLEGFENHISLRSLDDGELGADLNYVKGERTEIEPEPVAEDCAVEGDEDEDGFADCLDTDCATAEECETGETECADGMDNDGDGQADCADLGCDGFAGCEFGTETSCNDGIDNDGDGDVDGADSDCQASDTGGTTGGDGGDGGGCTVASAVTASTAAANFLLPLLPLFGAYGIRRIRNRK